MNSYKELQNVLDTLNTCLSANSDGYQAKNLNVPLTRDQVLAVKEALEDQIWNIQTLESLGDADINTTYQDGEI